MLIVILVNGVISPKLLRLCNNVFYGIPVIFNGQLVGVDGYGLSQFLSFIIPNGVSEQSGTPFLVKLIDYRQNMHQNKYRIKNILIIVLEIVLERLFETVFILPDDEIMNVD